MNFNEIYVLKTDSEKNLQSTCISLPKIIPFDGFKNKNYDKVELLCTKHGVYEKYISDLFNGNDICQKCGRSHNGDFKKLLFSDFEKFLKEKYPNIDVVNKEEYLNTSTKLKLGIIYLLSPNRSLV